MVEPKGDPRSRSLEVSGVHKSFGPTRALDGVDLAAAAGEIHALIGENGAVDSQPCGGTHVRSTGEIGEIHVGKIEKKGRENRRFRLRFGPIPA